MAALQGAQNMPGPPSSRPQRQTATRQSYAELSAGSDDHSSGSLSEELSEDARAAVEGNEASDQDDDSSDSERQAASAAAPNRRLAQGKTRQGTGHGVAPASSDGEEDGSASSSDDDEPIAAGISHQQPSQIGQRKRKQYADPRQGPDCMQAAI